MKFKTTLRGYSQKEVDKYIAELEERESNLHTQQRQRIEELADENFALREKLQSYVDNQQAISQALVDANNIATQLQGDAQKFAEVTLLRAKLFYVTWSSYAKTLVATLTDEEVRRFNELKDKIEQTINAYEGGDVASYATTIARLTELNLAPQQNERQTAATQAPQQAPTSTARRSDRLVNPIKKVEEAAGQTIDLRELLEPTESLADLCRSLGLDVDETADK